MKIKYDENKYLIHVCPGCNQQHLIPMWAKNPWTFNDNFNKPTLSPSIKHTITRFIDEVKRTVICHYFIEDGMIRYCGDCWHDMKNQTVELPDL